MDKEGVGGDVGHSQRVSAVKLEAEAATLESKWREMTKKVEPESTSADSKKLITAVDLTLAQAWKERTVRDKRDTPEACADIRNRQQAA